MGDNTGAKKQPDKNGVGDQPEKPRRKLLENSEIYNLDTLGPTQQGKGIQLGGVCQLMTCPYNESHRVGFGSFATHVHKCRMAASEATRAKYIICEYNATHHMFAEVYQDHLKICPDARLYDAQHFYIPPVMFGNPPTKDWETEKTKKELEEGRKLAEANNQRYQQMRDAGASETDVQAAMRRDLLEESKKAAEEEEQWF